MKFLKNLNSLVKKNRDKIVINYGKEINYHEFWKLTLNFANYLKKKKITKVCIYESPKPDYIFYLTMFASLISGATYIPINYLTPYKRFVRILKLSKADLVVSEKKLKLKKIKNINENDILKIKNSSKFQIKKSNKDAYIIFTSGSSGEPKGVRISREALEKYVDYLLKNIFNHKDIRCSQHPSIGFDLSVVDIYGTICAGGTLFPIRHSYDQLFLSKFIKSQNLTHWVSVPSAVDIITNPKFCKKSDLKSLKKIFFCGEILKKIHLDKIFKLNKKINVINAYGPTEATVSCTEINLNFKNYSKFCKPALSIGKPINGIKVSILKKKNNFNYGELIISGTQVSRGYLNNKDLNKKKFVLKKSKKFFYSGDNCKLVNGFYYFVSRSDKQVKVKGNRIELDEINKVIEKLIKDTVHTIINKGNIISFVTKKINEYEIKNKLSLFLPNYMIPTRVIMIKNWPRNKNQKIDERRIIKNL